MPRSTASRATTRKARPHSRLPPGQGAARGRQAAVPRPDPARRRARPRPARGGRGAAGERASSRWTRRTSATSTVEEGQPLTFTASFDTVPPFDPGDFATITLRKRRSRVVDEAPWTQALERLRDRAARYEPVEGRGVETGDTVIVDLVRDVETPRVRQASRARGPERTTGRRRVEIGAKANPPGFDDAAARPRGRRDRRPSRSTTRRTTRSRSWPDTDGRLYGDGQGDQAAVVPALDDEFAKDIGRVREPRRAARAGARRPRARGAARTRSATSAAELLKQLATRVTFEVPGVAGRARDRPAPGGVRAAADGAGHRPAAGRHRLERVPREPARRRARGGRRARSCSTRWRGASSIDGHRGRSSTQEIGAVRGADRADARRRCGRALEKEGGLVTRVTRACGGRSRLTSCCRVLQLTERVSSLRRPSISDNASTQPIHRSYASSASRSAHAARPDGGRADQPRRTRLRHLLAPAEGQHHLHRHADRRQRREPGDRADAVPRGRGPGQGHPALHQQPGRVDHGRAGDLRHDAVHQAGRADLLHRPGGVDGGGAAGGGREGQAVLAAELADRDPPAADVRAGRAGDRHRHRARGRSCACASG